jgi:hypothetical protein
MTNEVALSDIKKRFQQEQFRKELHSFADSIANTLCDKCNMPVKPQNSVAIFEWINTMGHFINYFNYGNRHLEPESDEDGIVTCEGSPSRFQLINSLPDPRPEWHSEGQDEYALAIWQLMQAEFAPKASLPEQKG